VILPKDYLYTGAFQQGKVQNNGMLGFIGQNIEYKSWDVLLKLYKTLVRPHLKYYYRKDIIKLERVQKRFTRMLPGLVGLSYKERLDRLGLFSLERRRFWGDLIEVYKITRGIDKVVNIFSQR